MPVSAIPKSIAVLLIVALAIVGWTCVFRTVVVVEWARRRYHKSGRLVRAYPFSNIVLKAWYPTYLRSIGIFVWFFDLLLVIVVLAPKRLA